MGVFNIFSIIIFIIIIVAAIYAMFNEKHRKLSVFIAFISVIVELLGVSTSINSAKSNDGDKVRSPNHENSQNSRYIEMYNNSGNIIVGNSTAPIQYNQYNEVTDTITLESARIKLEMKRYDDAAEIYLRLLNREPNNHIAQCNLGYIYACGLGTEIDVDAAREYYINAMLNGSIQAMRNYIAMELYNNVPVDDYFDFVWLAIEREDIPVCRFIAGSMQNNHSPDAGESIAFCQNLSEIPLDSIFAWEDNELIKLYSTPTSTDTIRYTKISVGTETRGDFWANLYTIYKEERRYCPYIDLLCAGFDEQI